MFNYISGEDQTCEFALFSLCAGKELSTRLLHTCWDSILDVLSVLVTGKGSSGISMSISLLFNAKEETRKAREAICTSLEGLQRAAYLACILGNLGEVLG